MVVTDESQRGNAPPQSTSFDAPGAMCSHMFVATSQYMNWPCTVPAEIIGLVDSPHHVGDLNSGTVPPQSTSTDEPAVNAAQLSPSQRSKSPTLPPSPSILVTATQFVPFHSKYSPVVLPSGIATKSTNSGAAPPFRCWLVVPAATVTQFVLSQYAICPATVPRGTMLVRIIASVPATSVAAAPAPIRVNSVAEAAYGTSAAAYTSPHNLNTGTVSPGLDPNNTSLELPPVMNVQFVPSQYAICPAFVPFISVTSFHVGIDPPCSDWFVVPAAV